MKIDHIDEILRDSFGLWISGLFGTISGWNPGLSLLDHKEAFFELLQRLLDQEKVRFCPPNELWHEGYDVWDADTETILKYLKSRWPNDVTSENDLALSDYFYEIPAILWVGPDGKMYGS